MIVTHRCPAWLLRAAGILLTAAALSAHGATVTLTFTNSPSNVTVTNGTPVPVNVVATTSGVPVIAAVTLNFRTWAQGCTNLWNALPMAATPTNFVATIPRLPVSNVDYYASCTFIGEDGSTNTVLSAATNTYTVGAVLDTSRNQDFESGWIYTGSYPNFMPYQAATGWTGWQARVYATNTLGGISGTNSLQLYGFAGDYVQSSWITGGVAYVTFAAKMRYTTDSGTLAVAYSTDGATWTTNASYVSLNGTTVLYPTLTVGTNAPCMIRVLEPIAAYNGGGGGLILVDNIAVAPPAAGLTLATNGISPPTPQSLDTVTINCIATDLYTNEPTINRRVTLWYNSFDTNSAPAGWLNQTMTNTPALPFLYGATLPPANAGSNVYYFTCAFDGYYYTNTDKRASYTSAPASYVINYLNISILQLGTNWIDFGGVATNAMPVIPLLLTNAGNVFLTVNSVDCAAPFACQTALPFILPSHVSTNLSISFAPGDLLVYTNLLTVNSTATAISGTNTVTLTGTGLVAETTTILSFTGPTNGPKNTLLTYTATASNNYSHAMLYQFDWGDTTPLVWTNANVQSHSWTNADTFNVNVRAASVVDMTVTSTWYALPTVTLTNTRAIRLIGNLPGLLDFGGVSTGITAYATVSVCNDGVDSLTVTNITAPSPFGIASPTNFTVAMNGTQSVTVSFAPLVTNVFTNTLTVWCDALSGTNTLALSGTGLVSEAISTPILNAAATNGQPGQSLSFWATAIDNFGYNIQYRFDWGNGTTSGWGTAVASGITYTNTSSWATPTTVLVRAQAQNATNSAKFSLWSLPISVAIDYTRVLGLGSNLLFGIAVTNTTPTLLQLSVTNSGTGPLAVSNVIGTTGFAASPTNFTLNAGVGSNITVTFTPALLQGYTGTITFVSNKTGGTNTVAASGTGVTFNAVSGLTGPASGVISNSLSPYLVSVTNSWAEPLAYMFGWGDGQTSGWQTVSSTSHVWNAVGTNAVQARVRSMAHTNVVSAWSAPLTVTIFAAPTIAFGTVTNGPTTNGVPLPVFVTIGAADGTVSNVFFWYLPPGSTATNMVSMTLTNGGGLWLGTLPPLAPGTMFYCLQYAQSGASLRYPSGTNTFSVAITSDLGPVRQDGFESGWTYSGSSPYYSTTNAYGWTGTWARVFTNSPSRRSGTLLNSSGYCILLMTNGAAVASPVSPSGIGTIYFQAGLIANGSGTIVVQVSTNNGANWISVANYTMTMAGGAWPDVSPAITLNLRTPAMVNIYQTNLTDLENIILDNIVISPPPTDVQLAESLHNPGYPNSKDPVRVRCQVTDVDPVNVPSVNRRLTVFYKYESAGSYSSSSMYSIGGNMYEGVIPAYPQGTNSYYFKCDFDGYYYSNSVIANPVSPYLSENISPAYLPDQRSSGSGPFPVLARYPVPTRQPYGSPLPDITGYYINFFRSEDASMYLQTTPSSVATPMSLVGDNVWQGLTLMPGITNLTWYFVGSQHYSNDATAFGTTISWGGGSNEAFLFPPINGTAIQTTNDPLHAVLVYDGFLAYIFTTTNQNYLVKRAVYQDFNTWQANQTYFESSLGLYATMNYTNDFGGWSIDTDSTNTTWKYEDFNGSPVNVWFGTAYVTPHSWSCEQAMRIGERAFQPPYNNPTNQSLLLNNSSTAPGRLWNTSLSLTEGIHNFSYRARLSQNDGRYAVYVCNTNGTPWAGGYRVTNTIDAISMSPAFPSVSLLLCYSKDPVNIYDIGSFYELRLTQISDATSADGNLQLALYRWNNGVNTKTVYGPKTYSTGIQKLTATPPLQIDVSWTNMVGYGVAFTGHVTRAGATLFWWNTNGANICVDTYTDTNRLQYGGTVGFLCSDAEAEISSLSVFTGTGLDAASLIPMVSYNASSNVNNWYFGRTDFLPDCWQTNSLGNLTRPIPTNALPQLVLYNIRTGSSGIRDPDFSYWTNIVTTRSVPAYTYTSVTQPFNIWDQTYVMLQYASGSLPIVVDDLSLEPWRAHTHGQSGSPATDPNGISFYDWTNTMQQYTWSQTDVGWDVFEGMVANTNGNNYVSFDRSRANPSLSQGVWSPVMTNGLGSIGFTTTNLAGTSVFRIEGTSSNDPTVWTILPSQTYTNSYTNAAMNLFVPVRVQESLMTAPGRIRIVQVPSVLDVSNNWIGGSSTDAVLSIDNLVAYDYPPPDATTWTAYNCLIARPSTNNSTANRAFETNAAAFNHATCYLNNSTNNGVQPPTYLSEHNPFVQTPKVSTGIGEIAFWYRAWDTNTAYVSIQAAPDVNTPDGQWIVIDSFAVTNLVYQYYDIKPFDTVNQVMRIYVTNAIPSSTTGRLCIDNILMTEPVRAGFDILNVVLSPVQPLNTDQVGITATIGHFMMQPQGIHLYCSYNVGTNTWGYQNWWGSGSNPAPGVATLELFTNNPAAPNTFVSSGTNFIPRCSIDTAVQFVVWGIYTNPAMVGRPFFQGTNTFVNPSWYAPVNLNTNYAALGWSPYYYVYSCPPGSVWINEVDYTLGTPERTNEYVEVIGPAGASIGNWKITLLNNSLAPTTNCVITNNFVFTNTSNSGWGFFVWGDTNVPNVNLKFSPSPPVTVSYANIPTPGAIKLIRSMGAVEDMVCWDTSSLSNSGYRYAGSKLPIYASPLALAGGPGSNKYNFVWNQPSSGNYTPGRPNVDQVLTNAPVILPLFYTLTSVIGANGMHFGVTNPLVAVQVSLGATTTVVYNANSWYRIARFISNGVTNSQASGTNQYVWTVGSMSQNVSNNASFSILPDSTGSNAYPTLWLAGFGMSESTPKGNDLFSLHQDWLLNMNPYASNTVNFALDGIAVTGSTVNIAVRLLESTNGVTYAAQPSIYGTLCVSGTPSIVGGAWASVTNVPPGMIFDTNGRTAFSFTGSSNQFYKALIQ